MNAESLLPKDKFDDSNLEMISKLTDEQIRPIILQLLEWLQDYNYPIADGILQILIAKQNLVIPYLSDILNGNNVMWKIWIMNLLIPKLSYNNRTQFKKIIERLSLQTEQDEDTIEIVNCAKECLERCYEE